MLTRQWNLNAIGDHEINNLPNLMTNEQFTFPDDYVEHFTLPEKYFEHFTFSDDYFKHNPDDYFEHSCPHSNALLPHSTQIKSFQ